MLTRIAYMALGEMDRLPRVRDTLKSKKRLNTPSESVASASSKRRRLTPVKNRRPTPEPISSEDDSETDLGQSEERQSQREQESEKDSDEEDVVPRPEKELRRLSKLKESRRQPLTKRGKKEEKR